MPLTPGNSRAIVSKNIEEMIASGHPQRVAVAASLRNARASAAGKLARSYRHKRKGAVR